MDNNIILTISSISIAVCGVSLLGLHMFTIGREKGRTISCQDSYNEGFNKGRSEGIRKAIQANLTSKMYPDGVYPDDVTIITMLPPIYIPYHSFEMTGYRFDGQSETLEIRYDSKHWSAFLDDQELTGSACDPFRSDIQREIEKRNLNVTEKL